jgi:hypothetical protein
MPLSLPEFVERWKACALTERAAAQSHFIDLCDVLGQLHPAAVDQTGDTYTFEKHVSKLKGGKGFADVWRRGYFAWEYKGKHKDLVAAYEQLADYREDLENPPLLVVCDLNRFEVHTNYTGPKRVYSFALDDLLSGAPTANSALAPLEVLRALFTDPSLLRPERADALVTEKAAAEFAKLAVSLRERGIEPEKAAHFLMRLLFCLFADSIGLLPDNLFRQMLTLDKGKPASFTRKLRQLFAAMSTSGSNFGMYDIHYFNGGLFSDDEAFDLTGPDLVALRAAAALNWAHVEPSIFGTLFERSLDPGKRAQLGAHYTSKEDILLIVEPVIVAPLARRWQEVKAKAEAIDAQAQGAKKGAAHSKLRAQLQETLFAWVEELSKVRVLDPACGSGNFLYVALRRMLDLWKEAYLFTAEHGLPTFLPHQVHPSQLFGLETNTYAHELASVVVWIGYLQWLNDNGIGWPTEPILRKLDNMQHRDAILAYDADGKPVEAAWPEADFIVGNPPFLGDKKMRGELGDEYVNALRGLYDGRVPGGADLVTFWFERAREQIASGKAKRAGLLATNSIRMVGNRPVLERILESGGIFMGWSDRAWILDGASVRVSMVGFDDGTQTERMLDAIPVAAIHADLSAEANVASAVVLPENHGLCFLGIMKGGPFDLTPQQADVMLSAPLNPNGRPNSDVVKRRLIGRDVVQRSQNGWLVDFGEMAEAEAALYELPFEYVRSVVKPLRDVNRDRLMHQNWWLHGRYRPALREALRGLRRCIVTPEVAKHRIFAWMSTDTIPDHKLHVFARDDDYFSAFFIRARTKFGR